MLDGVTLSHLTNDETDRTHPSINMGIPQYNALEDKACASYFQRKGLPKSVKNVKEVSREKGRERRNGRDGGGKFYAKVDFLLAGWREDELHDGGCV